MKKMIVLFVVFVTIGIAVNAQCSICTKTATQLGEKPAKGLNTGIMYLMFTPLAIAGYLGYRWWQREKQITD
jgi:TRAP-type C4-dicarboxylate transport system permease small subunit